jgi:RNA polymerase sigma factor (sigma-70 family)
MKISRAERRNVLWKQPSLLLVAYILLCNQTDGFQGLPAFGQSRNAAAHGTALGATKHLRNPATGKKAPATVQKSGTRKNDTRVRGRGRTRATGVSERQTKSNGGNMAASSIRYEMLQHDLLTAEQEQTLGRKIKQAMKLREKIIRLSEERYHRKLEQQEKEMSSLNQMTADLLLGKVGLDFDDDADDGLDGLSIYGIEKNAMMQHDRSSLAASLRYYGIEGNDPANFGYQNPTFMPLDSEFPDDTALTEKDIVEELGIPGGRQEVTKILLDGALARDTMISSNVKLVVSIAKKWCKQGPSNSGDPNDQRLKTLYAGSWTRPSLDEVIQEGILGLAEAADRFEPERQLKFGTYATYWIKNSVRKCFQNAATGCLRVPPHYHVLRQKYQKYVKECYQDKGVPPSMEAAAAELGLPEQRLQFMLKSTQSLIAMDSPAPPGIIPSRGGTAGAIEIASGNMMLSNTFAW